MPVFVGQLGREQVEVGFAAQLFERAAQRFAEAAIGEDDPAVGILAKDAQRQALDQRVIQRLAVAERLLRSSSAR